jgi:uncharacterized protein with PIN domain
VRFIADNTVGKLRRWLSLLGYDITYDPRSAREILGALREGKDALPVRERAATEADGPPGPQRASARPTAPPPERVIVLGRCPTLAAEEASRVAEESGAAAASATGMSASATGMSASAIGMAASATGMSASATGMSASATGMSASATGMSASATGISASAIGMAASAPGMSAATAGVPARAPEALTAERMPFGPAFFHIASPRLSEQIAQVTRAFPMDFARTLFSRCTCCNLELIGPLPLEAVAPKVPALVREWRTQYYRCPRCERVYWDGTHTEHVRAFLRDACSPITDEQQ